MRGKAYISQATKGIPEEQIKLVRERATKALESMGYEVVDSSLKDLKVSKTAPEGNVEIYYLSKSLEKMSECQAVYFCKGWENQFTCNVERTVAGGYDIEIYQG